MPFTVQSYVLPAMWLNYCRHCVCLHGVRPRSRQCIRGTACRSPHPAARANNVPQAGRESVNILTPRRTCFELNSDMFSDISDDELLSTTQLLKCTEDLCPVLSTLISDYSQIISYSVIRQQTRFINIKSQFIL